MSLNPLTPTYVIELGEDAVGIVILDRGGFRFHAADAAYRPLEGALYRTVRDAERAAAAVGRGFPPRARFPRQRAPTPSRAASTPSSSPPEEARSP